MTEQTSFGRVVRCAQTVSSMDAVGRQDFCLDDHLAKGHEVEPAILNEATPKRIPMIVMKETREEVPESRPEPSAGEPHGCAVEPPRGVQQGSLVYISYSA
jgi:hypothetical protein